VTVRRLAATALVAAGLALELGPGAGLIAAGIGFGWSGADPRVLVAVNRRHSARRRKGPRVHPSRPPGDGPAAAGTDYDHQAAA
jgi:hypothetical protein